MSCGVKKIFLGVFFREPQYQKCECHLSFLKNIKKGVCLFVKFVMFKVQINKYLFIFIKLLYLITCIMYIV